MSLAGRAIPGFASTAQNVEGATFFGPRQLLSGQQIDLCAILADRSPRRIIVDGFFQRYEYYRPYRQRIREWLAFDPSLRAPVSKPFVVLHVRRTDYVRRGWALPFSYYSDALDLVRPPHGEVWIATDDPADPFFKRFAMWKPKFLSGPAAEQFAVMSKANCIVMSESSYSWWAAFLGDPELIVCPESEFGLWSGKGEGRGINLIEPDRFLCLKCTERYRPNPGEELHAFKLRVEDSLTWRWEIVAARAAQWKRRITALKAGLRQPASSERQLK